MTCTLHSAISFALILIVMSMPTQRTWISRTRLLDVAAPLEG